MKNFILFIVAAMISFRAGASVLQNSDFHLDGKGQIVQTESPIKGPRDFLYKTRESNKVRGTTFFLKYAADVVPNSGPDNFTVFESVFEPNSQDVWSHFKYINVTHIQDGVAKAATTCSREVENRFLVHQQNTSCFTLNESICKAFVTGLKSRLGDKFDAKKLEDCSEVSRATNEALRLVNKIMKEEENAKIAESGMKRAINYAKDLGKEVNDKVGAPWTNTASQGKFEEWLEKSRFHSPDITNSIVSKCQQLNFLKDSREAVEGVDYKKASRERSK